MATSELTRPDVTQRDCFFTSIALNYLSKALALASSVFEVYPHCRFVMSIIDLRILSIDDLRHLESVCEEFKTQGRYLQILDPLSLYEDSDAFRYKYTVVEACTSIKPAVALHLLETADRVTYLDPDTILYSPLPQDPNCGENWDFQVTPHILGPSAVGEVVSERLFLFYGSYNLGYFAVQRTHQSLAFLRWWKNFCIDFGADAPQTGLFVDQKPVDLLTSFVDRVSVIRHPGCNMAWWNMFCDQRKLMLGMKQVVHRGILHELVFFHFSNLDNASQSNRLIARPLRGCADSGATSRFIDQDPALAALFRDYAERETKWRETCSKIIEVARESHERRQDPSLLVRLLFCEAQRRGMVYDGDPFQDCTAKVLIRSVTQIVRNLKLRDVSAIRLALYGFFRSALSPSLLRHYN